VTIDGPSGAPVQRVRAAETPAVAAPSKPAVDGQAAESRKLAGLASEFEAMLLGQMLREMRQAGSWKDESESDGMDNQALFDALDAELALRLAKAQPLGLGNQLVREITQPGANAAVDSGVASPRQVPAGVPVRVPASPVPLAPAAPAVPAAGSPGEAGSVVTSGFGWRQDPLTGVAAFHKGIDVRATYGEAVAAAGPGRVVLAQSQGGYGQTVVVDHGGGLQTRYAHLSAISVEVGDTVDAGAAVGRAGRSGRATGTHVHFEATQGGQPVDPAEFPLRLKAAALFADVGSGRTESWR
jgi:murein DD-endopeptidase MepM/ murein hydrolase activator NlpD